MQKKSSFSITSSLDIDRLVREEVTEWFTSNRKGLEITFRRVADKVREDIDALWQARLEEERERLQAEITSLRERLVVAEEEIKRMRQVLAVVRGQVESEHLD